MLKRAYFDAHHRPKGQCFSIRLVDKDQMESIDAVLDYYGNYTSSELVNLTHQEDPWKNAREGILDNAPSHAKITKDKIAEYYSNQCK